MLVRATRWAVVAAAVAMAGCNMMSSRENMLRPSKKPDTPRRYSARARPNYDAAVALTAERKYGDAAAKFVQLLPIFETEENHPRAADTLFWLGYCSEKLSRSNEARQYYRRVLKEYPQTPAARTAELRLSLLEGT